MKSKKNLSVETLCVQAGWEPKNGEPRVAPLYQSTTYKHDTADDAADLFALAKEGHLYTRISNPTLSIFEDKVAQMEGGVAAVSTASGQSALFLALSTLCKKGDHIIAFKNLYGGTFTILTSRLADFGIDVTFVDSAETDAQIESKIQENTKLIFGEVLSNPSLKILDIERYANLAHRNKLPLFVDNTFPTPYLCRPFDYGADVIIHSSSKYLDGHATSLGGIVVDSGKFDWSQGNFPSLTEPDPNYHDIIFTETFKEAAFAVKLRAVFLRDLGASMSPFNAFLTNLGAETLALRMDKHSANALAIAEYLESHPTIDFVEYPHLKSNPQYDLAQKYLSKGGSGVVSFGVKGGFEAAKKFINSLEMITLVVHVADVRSHVVHPASMTHGQMTEEAQRAAGVLPHAIRLSVGIENPEDIIADLTQALERSGL